MLRALYTSATGMKAQELLIDNTANNIANVNTSGFKKSHLDFADLLYSTLRPAGSEIAAGQSTPTGLQIGSGVRAVSTTKSFLPGTFEQTGNPLDVAIEGDGFFQVQLPDGGIRYTRNGALRLDANRQIVSSDGYLVSPAVTLPQNVDVTRILIGADGTITGTDVANPSQQVTIGRLELATFPNPAGLSNEGGNLYAATPASGQPTLGAPQSGGRGTIRGGFLEGSNVEVVNELIALIAAQRAYEINSRAIRAGDEMLRTAGEIVR